MPLHRNTKVEEAPLQNELMLFDPSSSQFFLLNSTMAYIWRNCENREFSQLVSDLSESFEGADNPEADLREALGELQNLGLIVDTATGST